MSRQSYIWVKGKGWVEAQKVKRARRSQGVQVIGDTIDQFQSMADGKHYDSKSRYRAEIRARGYEEVGNERLPKPEYRPSDATEQIVEVMKERGDW